MFFSLKTIIPLMAIVGAAMGQTSNTSSTKSSKSIISDLSDSCRKAMNGTDVVPECFESLPNAQKSGSFKSVCGAPIDGTANHLCTNDQVNKALDTLESSCKDELEKNQTLAILTYHVWLIYPSTRDVGCTKDADGSYCIEKLSNATEAERCQSCGRSVIEAGLKWKPIRSPSFINEMIGKQTESSKELAKKCNITVSDASSSSTGSNDSSSLFAKTSHYIFSLAMVGSTAFVVISAMVFNP
ncbi:hypothetical protein BDF19DRAFT_441048 [Syncephalis fuscata]|nr:hypothetical protein BDF19DRAFT_441048 [Syncephalis fuscata]